MAVSIPEHGLCGRRLAAVPIGAAPEAAVANQLTRVRGHFRNARKTLTLFMAARFLSVAYVVVSSWRCF